MAQTPPDLPAEPPPPAPVRPASVSTPTRTPAKVTGDLITMLTDTNGRRRFVFQGHVKIVGGGMIGTCDRLEIFGPDPKDPTATAASASEADKTPPSSPLLGGNSLGAFSSILASGSVTLRSGDRTALSDRAEIFPSPRQPSQPERVVLTGKPKITDGVQQLSGGRITFLIGANRVDVDPDPDAPGERPTILIDSFP